MDTQGTITSATTLTVPPPRQVISRPQHDRFKDAPWYPGSSSRSRIATVIGGAGGIGSWLALLLARAAFVPYVYDNDTIEQHNLSGQLFRVNTNGSKKVSALKDIVRDFAGEDMYGFDERMTENTGTHRYFFSAFDNMVARQQCFKNWKQIYGAIDPNSIFIDGRLTAEQMTIFCVRGGRGFELDRETYEVTHLFNDDEAEETICTMKQTSHAAAMIASHMVGFFTNFYTNVIESDETRTVPFHFEYFIPLNLLTIK